MTATLKLEPRQHNNYNNNYYDLCQVFSGTHDTLEHTRAYMEATQETHAGRPEVAVNLFFCFFPSWTVLPQGPPRSSGQLCSARGPSEVNCPSLVRDGHEF